MTDGGKFYSLMSIFFFTLKVLMASNITGMTGDVFSAAQRWRPHHDLGLIFFQWKNGTSCCARASDDNCLCRDFAAGIPLYCGLCGNDWVFQQDNAAVCSACQTKGFFQENAYALLVHPACSPAVNPIENICLSFCKLV